MTTPKHPYTNKLPYTLSTWRECVIWCAMGDGDWRECVAQVYGVFAVHKGEGDYCYGWVITHIPTGKRVEFQRSTWDAQQLAERLTSLGDWNTRAVWRLKGLREAM